MKRLLFKLIMFFMLVVAVLTINKLTLEYLTVSNLPAELKQIHGGPPVTGDFQLAGYWIPFSVVYIVEVLAFVYAGYCLTVGEVTHFFQGEKHER